MKTKSFTLIELMAVITLIAILSGIVVAGINDWKEDANFKKTIAYSNEVKTKLGKSLISEWKMNEGSGSDVYDSGRLSNSFFFSSDSGVRWMTTGCPEGNACLTRSNISKDNVVTSWGSKNKMKVKTICFWLKTSDVGSIFVLSKGMLGYSEEYLLSLENGFPKIRNMQTGHAETVQATKIVNDNSWHFICTTINDSVVYFKIDGEDVGSGNFGVENFSEGSSTPIYILENIDSSISSGGNILMDDLMMFEDSLF